MLEIGCGKGAFSSLLAGYSDHVTAVDLSPQMIRIAKEGSARHANIDFQTADILTWSWPEDHFDCIVSIATLHHLPLEDILPRCVTALTAGGMLLVLDLSRFCGMRNTPQLAPLSTTALYEESGACCACSWGLRSVIPRGLPRGRSFNEATVADYLASASAVPVSAALRLAHTGRLQDPRSVREAWALHGKHEHYLTLAEIRRVCAKVLPGARIRRHVLWRYSIVWRKASERGAAVA